MKKMLLILAILTTQSAFAAKLTINDWYRLNRSGNEDLAAEVCFSLEPAPTKPVFVHIIVDKSTGRQGNYSTWLGPLGSTCHVVSTMFGTVSVEIPELKVSSNLSKKL